MVAQSALYEANFCLFFLSFCKNQNLTFWILTFCLWLRIDRVSTIGHHSLRPVSRGGRSVVLPFGRVMCCFLFVERGFICSAMCSQSGNLHVPGEQVRAGQRPVPQGPAGPRTRRQSAFLRCRTQHSHPAHRGEMHNPITFLGIWYGTYIRSLGTGGLF